MDILKSILEATNQDLDMIDMEKFNDLTMYDSEYQSFFNKMSGIEHYRLLVYISKLFNNSVLFDIGTNRGYSAIALSANPTNRVISYDIVKMSNVDNIKNSPYNTNIEFKIGNFMELEDVHQTKFILLDTVHDGTSEFEVIQFLKEVKWNGILLLDDIDCEYFPVLNDVWNNLDLEKYNITKKGHWSGSGLAIFKG